MDLLRAAPASSRIRILVVDDHPHTAVTLARAITQISPRVEVISATNGRDALQQAKDEAVDILITDMNMPEMTGLDLIDELNDYPTKRPVFCFLVTAHDTQEVLTSAQRLKVKEVIRKPVRPERICQVIAKAIEELDQSKRPQTNTTSRKNFTILIADDQPDNLTLLTRYLENEGYVYIRAKDGLETLEKVRSEQPDLVLLDVNMPHKNGFEVLSDIRSDPATSHIPVIILTAARLDSADVQSGLNMGADDYVTKPFDRRELLARIRAKLRTKKAEDALRRRNRELSLLPEIGKELSGRLNMEALTAILLKRTVKTLDARLGHIVVFNSRRVYQKTYSLEPSIPAGEFELPQAVLEGIRETRQGVIVEDISSDPRWAQAEHELAGSAVVIPLLGRRALLGALVLTSEHTQYFTVDHLLLLQAIAGQASIAIENAQLYDTMAQEQQRLAAVLQSAADAILMFDAEGSLLVVNPAARKLFTDVETRLGHRLPSGAGYDSFLQILQEARQTNSSFAREVTWPDQRVFAASMTPVQEGGIVAVLHDVTHFKQLERVKDELIATASHDLRNPITSIKGFNVLIQKAGPLNENQTEFIGRIQHAVENMEELVENMLDLSKMDMGAGPKHEMMDLSPMLWALADEFQPLAQSKKQLLVLGHTQASSWVKGDVLKIRQALRNLIGNAIKYTPVGGVIMLSLEQKDGMVCIQIQDTGFGIPAADLPHIFDRFYRVRDNGHDDIEGNGLGLAIVKSIAEEHGGRVTVESEVGKGSQFTFSIPLLSNQEPAAS